MGGGGGILIKNFKNHTILTGIPFIDRPLQLLFPALLSLLVLSLYLSDLVLTATLGSKHDLKD